MSFSLSDTLSDMTKTAAALEKEPQQQQLQQQQARLQQQRAAAGEEPFTYLARALDRLKTAILEQLPPQARAGVELEARLGVFCHGASRGLDDERVFPHCAGAGAIDLGNGGVHGASGGPQTRFFPGVTKGAFEHMKHAFASLGGGAALQATHSHEVVFLYPGKLRLRCPGGGDRPPTKGVMEHKKRLMDVNVALPAAPYDLRITLSVEAEAAEERPVTEGWEARREKVRTSFRDTQGNATLGPWALDMTSVAAADNHGAGGGGGNPEEETAEVELELGKEACASWLAAQGEAADRSETSRLASRLLDTLKRLNPLESAVADASFLQPLPAEQRGVHELLRKRIHAIYQAAGGGGGGGRNVRFPGTMPVNLCRKDMAALQQGGYWLAEKTDGVRYLLFVLGGDDEQGIGGGGSCLLMDRSLAAASFPGAEGLAQALPPGTVLDGELVHNRLSRSYVFLAFDVLFWGNEPLLQAPFTHRLRALHQRVLPSYEQAVATGQNPLLAPGRHLPLVGKKFYRRTHVARLFARVSEEEGHRVYRDDGCVSAYLHYLGIVPKGAETAADGSKKPKRIQSERECLARYYHKTDGIVFQPDAPYHPGTDLSFFKWKWMDTVTVDFAITPSPYKVACGAPGGGQLDLTKQIRLEAPDMMRLRADIAHAAATRVGGSGGQRAIAECGFSVESGLWTYKMLRPDKTDPNYFTTVCTTMLELAEGIEEEELQYRLTVAHPSQDDWAAQVSRMRRAALAWRLSRLLQQQQQGPEGGGGEGDAMEVVAGNGAGEKGKKR